MRHQEAEPNAENATLGGVKSGDEEAAPNRRSYIRLAVMRSLLMGLERGVVGQAILPNRSSGSALDRDVQHGGNRRSDDQATAGAGAQSETGTLARSLSARLWKIRSELESFTGRGSKFMVGLRSSLGLKWVTARRLRYLHELRYNLRVPGRPWPERRELKKNEMLS